MAKKSRMSILKRQREVKKAEEAARKRAKRHGMPVESSREPIPTAGVARFFGERSEDADGPNGSQGAGGREAEPAEAGSTDPRPPIR